MSKEYKINVDKHKGFLVDIPTEAQEALDRKKRQEMRKNGYSPRKTDNDSLYDMMMDIIDNQASIEKMLKEVLSKIDRG